MRDQRSSVQPTTPERSTTPAPPIAPDPANDTSFSSRLLSKRGILVFRLTGGIASTTLGVVCLIWGYGERPLALALLALGIFILCHAGVESWFHSIRKDYDAADAAEQVIGFREFASAFVGTSGVILGLLAVFGDKTLKAPFTIKIGVVALVSDILIGTVLVGLLLASPGPNDQRAWNLIRYVFHLALWSLSLGLLCIAMALLYR